MKFKELLLEHGVDTAPDGHHQARPGWLNFDCPWCGKGSNKWHMGYSVAYGYVNCWRCGPHYLAETLAELVDIDLKEAKQALQEVERPRDIAQEKPRGKLEVPECVVPLQGPHKRYLRKRGFDPAQLIKLWNIQGIGLAGASLGLQWRLFIPIYWHGHVVSWTTRSLSDTTKKKYRTAEAHQEAMSHHEILYGEDYVRHTAL